jgi:hypothetical protein
LKKLSTATRDILRKQLTEKAGGEQIDEDFLLGGTEPKIENFSQFTINKKSNTVMFYFGQYQVAAYVFGEQEVTLPLGSKSETPEWLK